jgi:hypothetical protein
MKIKKIFVTSVLLAISGSVLAGGAGSPLAQTKDLSLVSVGLVVFGLVVLLAVKARNRRSKESI